MTGVAGLLAGLAVLVLLAPRDATRLRRAVPTRRPAAPRPGRNPLQPVATCAVAGLSLAAAVPWPAGAAAGLVVAAVGPRVLARLEPKAARREREQLERELPLVLDLLASCLAGGASLAPAAAAVAAAVPGPTGRRLTGVASALRVGSPAADAWAVLSGPDPQDPLRPAARALARAADGGAPVAAAVSRLAAEARAEARARDEQAARRVGVVAVAPLGLCFLPAFVLLGVVPVVVGLAGPLLSAF